MTGKFLPHIEVTTIVYMEKRAEAFPWDSAQGDDLKNNRAAIELNLARLLKRGRPSEAARAMIEDWLEIHLVLGTRQDLTNKHIRGEVSVEGHNTLYAANFDAVMESPELKRKYFSLAIDRILSGKWIVDDDFKDTAKEVKSALVRASTNKPL